MAGDFVSPLEWTEPELGSLLDDTERLRTVSKSGRLPAHLDGKSGALIWDAEGFRDRVAFVLGIQQMRGVVVEVPGHYSRITRSRLNVSSIRAVVRATIAASSFSPFSAVARLGRPQTPSGQNSFIGV